MKWLDDAPEDWDDAPEHPPSDSEEGIATETLENGIVVQDATEETEAYIYAWDGQRSLEECT